LTPLLCSITVIVEQREEIDEILARERIIERELAAAELQKYLTHPANWPPILGNWCSKKKSLF